MFFQTFWDIIKEDLMAMFEAWYDHDLDIFRLNFAMITLIPKALFGSFRFEGVWRGLRGIKSPTSQNPPQSPPILSNPFVGGINRTSPQGENIWCTGACGATGAPNSYCTSKMLKISGKNLAHSHNINVGCHKISSQNSKHNSMNKNDKFNTE